MATKKDFVIKNGLVVTEDIELGHASDTTIARASAGQITVEGTAVVLAGSASHDGFSDFVANEHIDHSGVSILGGDGLTGGGAITSNRTLAVGAGTGITVNSSDVAVTAAQTGITSLLNTSLAVGRDADNQIKFSTDNQMIFRVGAGDGVTFKASGEIEATKFDGALEGNADTATALATARAINGVDFDGTSPITITAAGSTLSDTVTVAKGGTGQTSYTDGQLLIGNTTGNTLAKATLTAGSGISVTNGAGSITIAATGGGGASALDDLSDAVTTATENVGIGENALDAISSGSGNHNTAIGFDSLTDVSTGDYNVGVGLDAGKSVTTGSQNTFLGSLAGGNMGSSVSGNVIIGYQSGYSAQSSSNSIAIGYDTGKFGLKSASYNIAIGYQAMLGSFANSTGANNNIGIGYHSMHDITTGDDNITIGYQAGELITTGSDNIAIGYEALDAATTEDDNIAIGYQAMSGAISGAEYNVVIGNFAGDAITSADNSVIIGYNAGTAVTTGAENVMIGYQSGYGITDGDSNVFIGQSTGFSGGSNEQGNVGIGHLAMSSIANADYNVGVGYRAGRYIKGQHNVYVGYDSGNDSSNTGSKNIGVGYQAGNNITSGSNNVVIGAADVSSATGDSQLSISSGDGGVTWITGTSAGHVSLGNFTFDADQTVGSGQDNYVLTYDNSAGTIGLEAASGGGVSLANDANNRVVTATGSGGINGEANLTFNGSTLALTGDLNVGSGDLFVDDSTGRVGIGIGTSPINLLHIKGDNSTTSQSSGGAASITIEQDGTGDAALNFLLTGVQRWIVGIDNSDSDKFKIQTGSTSLGSDSGFTIDTSGNVGIGTTSPQSTMHISSGTSGDAVLILEADTDNNDETDQPYIVFEQDGGVQHSAIGSFSGQNTDNNALIFSNSVDNSGVQAGMVFKTGTSAGYANATESMRIYPAGETQARKTKVKTVSSNTTLGDDDSGKTIYWTGGTLTLPATAESGQQFVVINNKGSSATPGLGTSNSIQTGWTAHAAMADETARTYIAVAANKWIYIG